MTKKKMICVSLLALGAAFGLSGCAVDAGTESATLETGTATKVHEQSLGDGATLTVFDVNGEAAIRVIMPRDSSAELLARSDAAAEAPDFESRFIAWTGGESLPEALSSFAEAEKKALAAAVSAAPREGSESKNDGGGEQAKLLAKSGGVEVGIEGGEEVRGAEQAAVDWAADGQNFLTTRCGTNSKQYSRMTITNYTARQMEVNARYHRMHLDAADGQALYKIFVNGSLAYSDVIASGSIMSWDQAGVEAQRNIRLEGTGLGPNPRIHQCMLWGWEKVTAVRTIEWQTPVLTVDMDGLDFLPGSTVRAYFVHPTRGDIQLGSFGKTVAASGTVTNVGTNSFQHDCRAFYITRESKYQTSTLALVGSDGRRATTTTSKIYNGCWWALPAK